MNGQLRPNPFRILFPEVHAWIQGGAPIRTLWIYIALGAFTILLFAPTASHDFVSLADHEYVRDNPHVANGLTFENVLWAFRTDLMTSPIIVTFPLVLLLIDYWPLGRLDLGWRFRELLAEKIPLFTLSAVASVITFFVEKKGGDLSIFDSVPFPARLANALLSYARYLAKIFWPANLSIPYRYNQDYDTLTLCAVGVMLVFVTGAVIYFRRKPYLVTGWFWYLGTLVPVIGLIQIVPESMADRYMYVPSIGILTKGQLISL